MPDPQETSASVQTPADGIDLSGLRTRTIQQAKSELPQPQITPPWEDEPSLPSAPTSKIGKAYQDGKQLLEKYGQHFSEKVLTPFREGLDRIGDQLQEAGESGHTQSGGPLTGPARALVSGAGTLLKQTPIGRDLKSTALAWATPPELGPEGRALSRELNAWERTGKEIGTVYHGGKTTVGEVDPSKLQQRDAGFYGPGFYVTKNEQYAKTYGNKVSEKAFNPDAKILDVGTIHPGYEKKVNPELQKEIEVTQRAYLAGLPKAQKNPNLVNDYLELIDPKSKSFDLHSWIEAVNRHAEQKGYDAIRFSDGEIVVRNPKALTTDLSGLRTRPMQKPSAGLKELPAQPRLPDTGTHAAIKTDDGGIYPDLNPEKQRTHIMLAQDLGIPPERVVSGGWLKDGEYEGSERSDAGRWGEQARAQAAVTEKRSRKAADAAAKPVTVEYLHNTQKAPDLGSRFGQDVEPHGKYIIEKTPGSTTPEGWQSGKVTFNKPLIVDFGGGYQESSNWKNVLSEKYEGKTGKALSDAIRKDGFDGIITKRDGQTSEIVDLTSSNVPATKTRERQLNLKGVGIGLNEMDPADAKNWVGYTNQKSLKIYRGVDDPSHAIGAGDFVTTSKESAQNYGKHVQELEVSPAELRYVRGHKDGDPLKLDQGGQTELIYAPKAGKKTATETLYHGSPDVSKIDSLKPGNSGGYFGNGVYLTRDPDVARRFTKLESANPTLERNADGSFTDINTGKRVPGGKPGVLSVTLKDARLKKITIEEMESEVEKFRKPTGAIDLDAARNAVAEKYAKQGYDGFDVPATKNFDEPQVLIFPRSATKLSITKPLEGQSIPTPAGAPKGLESLAAEARKSGSFDEFRKNFLRETKHGEYWHITSDPNFTIDPEKGPRDMSSLADAAMEKGKLMVTSHLENWAEEYPERKYAALIDMSEVPHEKYRQINRGFGNEFFVDDPSSAKVAKVLPIEDALKKSSKFDELLGKHINSDADLKQFYDQATKKQKLSGPKIDLSGLRVRPVEAGRQSAGMDTFVASDGKKYQYPASDVTWNQILKADPGAKRIK